MRRRGAAARVLPAAALAAWLAAGAAPAAEPGRLGWEDCVVLASRHNPALAASRAEVAAAEADTGVARSVLRPQLSAGASAVHAERDGGGAAEVAYGASVGVDQSLYSGGRNRAGVRSAQAALEQAHARAAGTRAQVTHELRAAFANLLYAQAQVGVQETIAQRRRDNFELVDLRYEGGREHKGSLAMSRATLHDAEVSLRQARRLVSVAGLTLLRTIGLPQSAEPVELSGSFETAVPPAVADWEQAVRATPDYAAAAAARAGAEARLAGARSGYRPDLGLAGEAGRSGDEDAFEDDEWSVGLRLSFPFWQGGRTTHEVRGARAGVEQAEANLADTANLVARDLAETLLDFSNAVDAVDVQQTFVEAAETRAEIARQQYEDGLLSFENWDLIEDDLIGRRRRLLEARRAALLAEAAWWRITGRDTFAAAKGQ